MSVRCPSCQQVKTNCKPKTKIPEKNAKKTQKSSMPKFQRAMSWQIWSHRKI